MSCTTTWLMVARWTRNILAMSASRMASDLDAKYRDGKLCFQERFDCLVGTQHIGNVEIRHFSAIIFTPLSGHLEFDGNG